MQGLLELLARRCHTPASCKSPLLVTNQSTSIINKHGQYSSENQHTWCSSIPLKLSVRSSYSCLLFLNLSRIWRSYSSKVLSLTTSHHQTSVLDIDGRIGHSKTLTMALLAITPEVIRMSGTPHPPAPSLGVQQPTRSMPWLRRATFELLI